MCMCDRHLTRRDVMRGAMAIGTVAVAGGFGLVLPESALAAVPEPRIYSTGEWGARGVRCAHRSQLQAVLHRHSSHRHLQRHGHDAVRRLFARPLDPELPHGQQRLERHRPAIHRQPRRLRHGRPPPVAHATPRRHQLHARRRRRRRQRQRRVDRHRERGPVHVGLPPAALYNKLVDLCAYICDQYNIASSQIFGHRDFMATACPGNILYGMLPELRSDVAAARAGGSYTTTVDNATAGRFTASGNWGTSSWSSQKHGANYRYANPVLASDSGLVQGQHSHHAQLPGRRLVARRRRLQQLDAVRDRRVAAAIKRSYVKPTRERRPVEQPRHVQPRRRRLQRRRRQPLDQRHRLRHRRRRPRPNVIDQGRHSGPLPSTARTNIPVPSPRRLERSSGPLPSTAEG